MHMRIYSGNKQCSEIPSPKQAPLYTVYEKTLYELEASNFVVLSMQLLCLLLLSCVCVRIFSCMYAVTGVHGYV